VPAANGAAAAPEVQRVGDLVLPGHHEPVQSGAALGDGYGAKPAQVGRPKVAICLNCSKIDSLWLPIPATPPSQLANTK
jgi:hypothetical protein